MARGGNMPRIELIAVFVTLQLSLMAGETVHPLIKLEPPLEIAGAKVAKEADARCIAFDAYIKKMRLEVLATEGVRSVKVMKLGYDIPGFAKQGEPLWEARVMTLNDELRAILWINPHSEAVYFVVGPWKTSSKNPNDSQDRIAPAKAGERGSTGER